jgi:hypothetical protein
VEHEAPIHDDIAVERDEDAAHHLLIREADETTPSLFEAAEEEATADLALDHAAIAADDSTRWKAEPAIRDAEIPPPAPGINRFWTGHQEERGFAPATHDDVLTTPAERPRPAILPLAFTAIVCLLIGYTIRDAVGGRQTAATTTPTAETAKTTPPPAPTPASSSTAPQQPGRAYSEQAIAPPAAAAAQARGEAPPVPGDAPAADAPVRAPKAATASASSARLTVLSTPKHAGVMVNGKWRGRTPLTLDALPLGTYTVRVLQPGFVSSNEEVTLSTRQPMRTISANLQPISARASTPASGSGRSAANGRTAPAREPAPQTYSGTIFVDSRPRGATILIDGKLAGTTPASIPDVPIGSHVVRLELADHRAWTTSTRVAAGEQARVTGSLERIR